MPGRSNVKEQKLAYHTTLNKAICRMIEYNIELMGGKLDYPLENDKESQYNVKKTNKKSRTSGSVYKRKPLNDNGVMSRKKKSREMDSVGNRNPLYTKGVRSRKKTQTGGVGSSEGSESDGSRGSRSGDGSRRRISGDGSRRRRSGDGTRSRSRTPSRGRRGHDDYRVPEMGVNVRTAWDIGITIGIMSLIMGLGKNVLLKTLLPHIVRGLEYVYGIDPEHRDRSLAHLGIPMPCSGSGYFRNMLLTGIGFQEHTCEDIDRMYTAAFRDEIGRFVRTVSLITGSTDVDMSYIVQGINALVFALILESVRRVPVYARIASRAPVTMGRVVGRTITTGTRMTGNVLASIGRTGYNTTYQGTCLATRMMFWLVDLTFLLDRNSELYQEGSRRFIAHRGFLQFCKASAHFTIDQFKRLYKLIKRNLSSAPVATAEFGTAPEERAALEGFQQMHEGEREFQWDPETEGLGLAHPLNANDLPGEEWIYNALSTGEAHPLGFKRLDRDSVLRGDNTDTSGISSEERLATRSPQSSPRERVATRSPQSSPRERVATRSPQSSPRERVATPTPQSLSRERSATKQPRSSPRDRPETKKPRSSRRDRVPTKGKGALDELATQILRDPQVIKLFDLGPFIRSRLSASTQEFTIEEQERIVETVIENLSTNTDPSEEDIIAEISDVVMKHNRT